MKLNIAFVLICLLSACGGSDNYEMKTGKIEQVNKAPETKPNADLQPVVNLPVPKNTSVPQPLPNAPEQVQSQTAAVGLNPAHGQPGHNCAIAVGAPLNSTPSKTIHPTPQTTTTTVMPTLATNQPQQVVAKGMNPAHGQPGHRCDIAVGAPLNSKPTQPAVTQTSTNASTAPISHPALSGKAPITAPPVAVAAGMNPSHGQPGHRCDIALGAPLNSKPTATTPTPVTTPSTAGSVTIPTSVSVKKDSLN